MPPLIILPKITHCLPQLPALERVLIILGILPPFSLAMPSGCWVPSVRRDSIEMTMSWKRGWLCWPWLEAPASLAVIV